MEDNKNALEELSIEDKIIKEDDPEELKKIVNLFNLNLKKKELVRKGVISQLQDKALEQISSRINNHPDQFNNKDLLDYAKTFNDLINKSASTEDIGGSIHIAPTQININVDENKDSLDRESRRRVTEAVKSILSKIDNEDDVIDVSVEDKTVDIDKEIERVDNTDESTKE